MNLITIVEMSTKFIFLFAFVALVYGVISVNSKYNDELEESEREEFREDEKYQDSHNEETNF